MAYKALKTKRLQNYRSAKNYPVFLTNNTMKPLSETYKELGIAFSFPIEIKDANGRVTYYEDSDDHWERFERDAEGRPTYSENIDEFWQKWVRNADGDVDYYEDSTGVKKGTTQRAQLEALGDRIKDAGLDSADYNGNQTYYEDSTGVKKGTPKAAIILDEEESIRFAEMLEEEPSQPTPEMQRAIQAYRDFIPSGNISPKNPIGIPSSITNNQ
jgi:hypothetical protein